MKCKRMISVLLVLVLVLTSLASLTVSAAGKIVTPPTGYTKASDVAYKTSGGYIANWGARGEDCVFLSTYAERFYTGSYTFDVLSKKSGGTSQSNAPQSELYAALKSLMTSKHSHTTSYNETRNLYRYTDCLKNDTAHISSFYSGRELSGTWDSGATWNREHTWPNSKGLNGADENDIMMLRPTWVSENSSRGNTAYGQGSGYYDPGEAVRGDCARIVLYVYTRWGNTGRMWGTSGVMQNLDTLLRWMEEDPVDTWEMGRNDAVQAITGTRNVYVDYPEYAWLLFGRDVPEGIVTPSGEAGEAPAPCKHERTRTETVAATCTEAGAQRVICTDCGAVISAKAIPALGHADKAVTVAPTCTEKGYTEHTCTRCSAVWRDAPVEALGHDYTSKVTKPATATEPGVRVYTCGHCQHTYAEQIPATGTPAPQPGEQFSDLDTTSWYYDGVSYMLENGYMNGVGGGKFEPNGTTTRAMVVTILWRMEGSPAAAGNPFRDVADGEWYTEAIAWAAENRIVDGVGGGRFAPQDYITREQMATILFRYAAYTKADTTKRGTLTAFEDCDTVSLWALDALRWATAEGIINGTGSGLEPQGSAVRAQVATILWRYLEQ